MIKSSDPNSAQATPPKRVAVLVSGNGSNLQAIIDDERLQNSLSICGVISNQPNAYALERAKIHDIPALFFGSKRAEYEPQITNQLREWEVDLVILAGFMRVLSSEFIQNSPAAMINLHPSLLPAYKGLNTHARVLDTGDRRHGCSVHAVTAQLDDGQVLAQSQIDVTVHDTPKSLQARVQMLEHHLLCEVLLWFSQGRLLQRDQNWMLDQQRDALPVRFYG